MLRLPYDMDFIVFQDIFHCFPEDIPLFASTKSINKVKMLLLERNIKEVKIIRYQH